ncbi:MAG: endonuclease [Bacteroidaceae bacterium]|nr:endonuclease [Bacteroidaceae bacterium]
MKRLSLPIALFLLPFLLLAQAPAGYYTRANGKSGSALKTALCAIITSGHVELGYDNLWNAYKTTDVRPDGKLWDMYSDMTNYDPNKPSGSYHQEGDVPNREHSFPKSWWGGNKNIAYCDIFHVVPADGYINNIRGNLPFGETSNPNFTSHGGFSKRGPCDASIGYSGTVFEPNDEYKGDFARIYFYMCTRYEESFATWDSPMLAGNKYPGYTNWAITMLLRWAAEDPVSQKEIDRNNAIFTLQKNRNPYVDFPGLEQYVWGSKKNVALDINDYEGSGQGSSTGSKPAAPTFSPESGELSQNTTVTITAAEGCTIYYRITGGELQSGASPVSITITEETSITAFCSNEYGDSPTATAHYTVTEAQEPEPTPTEGIFKLITSASELQVGDNYLIVWESGPRAMAEANGKVRSYVDIVLTDHTFDLSKADKQPTILRLGQTDGYYTFYIPTETAYLALSSDANNLGTEATLTTGAQWTISFTSSNATITNRQYDERSIYYNSSSPRFAAYKSSSSQRPVQLYREVSTSTGISLPMIDADTTNSLRTSAPIYTLQGRLVTPGTKLRSGIYIQNGRKYIVR